MRDSFWTASATKAALFEHTQKTIAAKVEAEKPKPPKPAPKPLLSKCQECGRMTSDPCR